MADTDHIREGWKLVPLEPTLEMMKAVDDAYSDGGDFPDMWAAALAAANGIEPSAYKDAIGRAGEEYYRQFQHAHPLPARWRWSDLWERMSEASRSGGIVEETEATDEMIDAACAAVPDLYRVDAARAIEAALRATRER